MCNHAMQLKPQAATEPSGAAKPIRVIVQLTHWLAAGTEIHAVLPDTLDEFEEALARGELADVRVALESVLE